MAWGMTYRPVQPPRAGHCDFSSEALSYPGKPRLGAITRIGGELATPREIIERIRRKEYLYDVEMSAEIAEGAENMRINLNNALKTLAEDLYSKDTHFVLEL